MLRVWRLIQGGYAIVKERETFASRLGFVLISAGCAIGLGNVWRFPYIVGQYGGAAFVLIYLLFLVIMGLPIMAMEFSVGRASRKSILASFQVLEPKGSKWHWYGWFGMAGNYLLMMFYTTIAGWLLLYFFKVAAGEFRGLDAAGVENAFGAMQGNVGIQLLFMGIVVVLGMLICSRGLKNGVEKVNKAMMLCLLALLVVLAVRALTLPGAMEGVKFYLVPNFHNLMYDADGSFRLFRAIYDAMGQAFFSLSINGAGMLIYGSYMKKGENILRHAGMTAVLDTLAALREAKRLGARVLSIVNVVGSTIARESDDVLYTWAGPEIAVATTKAFSTQLAVVYLIGLYCAEALGTLDEAEYDRIVSELLLIPTKLEQILDNRADIQYFASLYFNHPSIFLIGRNIDYAIGMEGSLKLKEISYIHSEAYAAGELKHGTISLIEPGTLVVALGTYAPLFDKAMSNVVEVKSRGADVLGLTVDARAADMAKTVDHVIPVPDTHPLLLPSLDVVPMQLFAYYVALQRGCDIDKPRNLAKSVTVE